MLLCWLSLRLSWLHAPRRAHSDPFRKRRDLGLFQFAGRRHLQVFINLPHGADEQALSGISCNNRGTASPALQQAFASIQKQASRWMVGPAVAPQAALRQDRANALFEIFVSGVLSGDT